MAVCAKSLANHNRALKKRHPGTGTWFITGEVFANWKRNSNSFLWLYGMPGCGKTVLSSTIIDDVSCHFRPDPTVAVIFFYFDFNDNGKQLHEKMLRSLITQLSAKSVDVPQPLELLFASCSYGTVQPISEAIMHTLREMLQQYTETYVILDAIDECKDREKLLSCLGTMIGWNLSNFHLLVTARKEKEIEISLDPFSDSDNKLSIHSTAIDKDIYIHMFTTGSGRIEI